MIVEWYDAFVMLKTLSQRWFSLSFIACLVVAVLLRFWQLGAIPVGLYWDEQAMLVDITSVVQTGKDMHGNPWTQLIYPSYGDYKLPVYIWAASLGVKLFGVTHAQASHSWVSPEWMVRFPSALAGVGTVVITGLIASQLATIIEAKNKQLAKIWQMLTMFVVALSPWSIMFSRTGFEGHLGQFLLASSVLSLLLTRKKVWWLVPAILLGSLATYSYFSVRFVWPVVTVAVLFYQYWRSRNTTKSLQRELKLGALTITAMVGFVILLIPMQRAPFYAESNAFRLGTDSVLKDGDPQLQSNILREQTGNTKWGRIFYHKDWLIARELLKNYSDNFSLNFLFIKGDPNWRHGTQAFGLFVWPLVFAWLIGLYQVWRKDKVLWLVLVVWWLVALLPASVPQNTPHALRSLNALVPLSLFIGMGLTTMAEWAITQKNKFRVGAVGLYFGLVLLITTLFIQYYFSQYARLSAHDWQDGYRQLATVLANKKPAHETTTQAWVTGFDDKFFLWVMANGQYTGQDFQSWPTEKFQYRSFDGYHLQDYSFDRMTEQTGPLLLAGRKDDVEAALGKMNRTPSSVTPIAGVNPEIQFLVAEFK